MRLDDGRGSWLWLSPLENATPPSEILHALECAGRVSLVLVPCHGVNDHGEGVGWLVLGLDDAVRLDAG